MPFASVMFVTLGYCYLPSALAQQTAGVHHLDIRLMDWRGFRGTFFLDMTRDGALSRRGDSPLGPERLDGDARKALQDLLARERFFALRKSYGSSFIEGRFRLIQITLDGRFQSVAINDVGKNDTPAAEISRALRVWYGALRALSDPGAIQIEADDKLFLAARK